MTVLTAVDASVLARIAGNPKLAGAEKNSLIRKLSPEAKKVARVLFGETNAKSISAETRDAARAVHDWAKRQRKSSIRSMGDHARTSGRRLV